MMTSATLCHNAMYVHALHQETADVFTLILRPAKPYSYLAGQYAFVNIGNNQPENKPGNLPVVRAYTISSSPNVSEYISITVRQIPNGVGSQWLTTQIKVGDTLWLSDAQGDFTCATHADNKQYLMLAAGCGITPIMSMTRWLMHQRKNTHVTVIYNAHSVDDVIFAQEWQQLAASHPKTLSLHIMAKQPHHPAPLNGRLSFDMLKQLVPDAEKYTVMSCGPESYMALSKTVAEQLGVKQGEFYQESFFNAKDNNLTAEKSAVIENTATGSVNTMAKLHIRGLQRDIHVPVGTTLLAALEQHDVPVFAACRAGVCGSCKVQVISGDTESSSQMTLSADEIASGYVLACSCTIKADLELA
ncbi:MAG: NADH oxidoreductase [Plesiomonas sp.]